MSGNCSIIIIIFKICTIFPSYLCTSSVALEKRNDRASDSIVSLNRELCLYNSNKEGWDNCYLYSVYTLLLYHCKKLIG